VISHRFRFDPNGVLRRIIKRLKTGMGFFAILFCNFFTILCTVLLCTSLHVMNIQFLKNKFSLYLKNHQLSCSQTKLLDFIRFLRIFYLKRTSLTIEVHGTTWLRFWNLTMPRELARMKASF